MDSIYRVRDQFVPHLSKWAVTCYFAVCIWFGYELDESNHLAASHLASVLLLFVAVAFVFLKKKVTIRRIWGTRWDARVLFVLLSYVGVRLAQSLGNDFFWGQAFKLVLILTVFIVYKTLDSDGKHLDHWAVALPSLLAAMILIGLVIWSASGKLLEERFRVGPNDYEYVSEYACHMLPFVMFSFERASTRPTRYIIVAIGLILIAGLGLTGSRAALAGGALAICTYGFLARKRLGKYALGIVIFLICLVVLGFVGMNTERVDVESDLFADNTTLNQVTSGRLTHWVFELEQVTQSSETIIFGTGLGKYAEWVPESDGGGFYRTAVVNALLAAWVPFGIIGLIGYLWFYRYLWRRISLSAAGPYRSMAISLFVAYVFTDQFETHWQGTKMLWFVSFILYVWTLSRPRLQCMHKAKVGPRRSLRKQIALLNSACETRT
jgi:O-antigen ligase/polysaccharide polymerase Wzy-like membrane protein